MFFPAHNIIVVEKLFLIVLLLLLLILLLSPMTVWVNYSVEVLGCNEL